MSQMALSGLYGDATYVKHREDILRLPKRETVPTGNVCIVLAQALARADVDGGAEADGEHPCQDNEVVVPTDALDDE